MSTLEQLIGKPLHEATDEELEAIVLRSRFVREQAMAGKGQVKRATTASKKSPKNLGIVDLSDIDDEEDELDSSGIVDL